MRLLVKGMNINRVKAIQIIKEKFVMSDVFSWTLGVGSKIIKFPGIFWGFTNVGEILQVGKIVFAPELRLWLN